jgi:hypothetical protein
VRARHKFFPLPVPGSAASALDAPGALLLPREDVALAFAGQGDGACLSCEKRVGTQFCASCDVVYCATCWAPMHANGNRAKHAPKSVFQATFNADGSPYAHTVKHAEDVGEALALREHQHRHSHGHGHGHGHGHHGHGHGGHGHGHAHGNFEPLEHPQQPET